MKDISESVYSNLIPQLGTLRRVPIRYRRILPLTIMKQYQCIVVGAERGILTVAIADRQNMAVLELLSKYTGQAIFPVLIEPNRMRLLIQRIERREQYRRILYSKRNQAKEIEIECYQYTLQRLQISSILMLVTSQKTRGS
jgi:hypothetical protein